MTYEQRWKLSQVITKKWKNGAYKDRKRRKGMRIFLFAYIAPNERVYDDLVRAESQRLAIIEFQRRNGKLRTILAITELTQEEVELL